MRLNLLLSLMGDGPESTTLPEGLTPSVVGLRALVFALCGQWKESQEALHQVLEALRTKVDKTPFVCPFSVTRDSPLAASHTRAVPSTLAVTMRFP